MKSLRGTGRYDSDPAGQSCAFPGFRFYRLALGAVFRAARGLRSSPDLAPLQYASFDVLRAVEAAGGTVHVDGLEHLRYLEGPVVLVGNHMSTLETFVLPGLILPFVELTFVLKRALVGYPFLGTIVGRLRAIAVERKDARADLMQVMKEGPEHLEAGHSIVVFPQSTRTTEFDASAFNTLGVKLAKRGGARVVPFAVDTRFWGTGKIIKDIGRISPGIPVRISFGAPIEVTGNGKEAHATVIAFITEKLEAWR